MLPALLKKHSNDVNKTRSRVFVVFLGVILKDKAHSVATVFGRSGRGLTAFLSCFAQDSCLSKKATKAEISKLLSIQSKVYKT